MWTTKPFLIIVTTAILLQNQIQPSEAGHIKSCVGLSVNKKVEVQFKQGIGSYEFYKAYIAAWPYDLSPADASNTPRGFNLKMYGVEVDGKVLRGWFHVVLSIPSNFQSFVMHAVNENRMNIGEFVYNFPPCTDPDGHQKHEDLTEYMYIPCGGVAIHDLLPSTGIKFLRSPSQAYSHLVPEQSTLSRTEFHFMYRLATTSCTQPAKIGIFAKSSVGETVYSGFTDYITLNGTNTIGATDPIPRAETYKSINCHADVTNAPYYVTSVDRAETQSAVADSIPCSVSMNPTPDTAPLFVGRCFANDTSGSNVVHGITCSASNVNGLEKYDEYLEKMKKRYEQLCTDCQADVPPRPITTTTTITIHNDKMGVPLTIVTALEVWDGRIIHGIAMTIIAIFLLPVNIFITRHYKETFMGTRILFLRVWYFVHHLLTGIIILFYFVGLSRIYRNRKLLGVNLHPMAGIHRLAGWTSVGVTLAMAVFGGWRCMARLPRNCCIAMHWSIGMAIYFTNYGLMILSVWIPGSPAAAVDVTQTLKDGTDGISKAELILYLVVGWIILDVVLHLAMTVFTCMIDAKYKLSQRRLYLPSPIPVFRENATDDIMGSKVRILLLIVYGTLSLCFTLAICYLLITQDENGRGLGEMSCTHKPLGRGYLPRDAKTDC